MAERQDLRITLEEVDLIIIQQIHVAEKEGMTSMFLQMADVFVLLAHFSVERQLSCNVLTIGTSTTKLIIYIKLIVETHCDIVKDLLPAHALLGCDLLKILCSRFLKEKY